MEPVPEHVSFPEMEEGVLAFWKKIDAFRTSLKQSEGKPEFSFYDGPPFATGMPHYGHILAGTIKDTVCRYAHSTGHHVTRRFGWDCHGLPIEFEIDKQLGVKTRQEVLDMGIAKYNAECRKIVMRYSKEWEQIVSRLGRWIDFENDYKTMEPWYMESIWWVFKQLFEKGLVYRGFRVMPYSTACATPLSNFEANMEYKEVQDPEVYVKFPLEEDPDTKFLAWTTTPWTLPSNLALCVNAKMTYVKIKDTESGEVFIMAESLLPSVYPTPKKKKKKGDADEAPKFEVLESFLGATLKGKRYVPLFKYFERFRENGAFQVLTDDYVKDDSGTGVVHQAPGFGEDDYRCCLAAGIIKKGTDVPCPLDANGRYTDEVADWAGVHVKEADIPILKYLKGEGRVLRSGKVKHSYPFCWRSDTPLVYRAVSSWFVNVPEVKEKLLANNAKTYWVPQFVKEKRFHNWLSNAVDWNVSRNRFWGCPIPLWTNEDFSEVVCVGSIEELEQLSGVKVTDLHREFVDDVVIQGKTGPLRRVEEVFDCWFESGSMPYAQLHYPFENREFFEKEYFPADFIAEGIDQTRGWFYTLLVLSTCLFDKPPFKNLIANGLVLAEYAHPHSRRAELDREGAKPSTDRSTRDGKKMSKRLRNYPDPQLVVSELGADALRLYLLNSPSVRGEDLRFRSCGVKEVVRDTLLPFYNVFRFLVQSILQRSDRTGEEFVRDAECAAKSANVMDQWILSAAQSLNSFVRKEMKLYRLYKVGPQLVNFVEELRNWYVRFNRKRLKGSEGEDECKAAVCTLFEVMMITIQLMTPFTPFFCEHVYATLRHGLPEADRDESVHYRMMPEENPSLCRPETEAMVKTLQSVITLGRAARDRRLVPLKFPLKKITVVLSTEEQLQQLKVVESYIKEELNVVTVDLTLDEGAFVKCTAQPEGRVIGPQTRGDAKKVSAAVREMSHEDVKKLEREGTFTVLGHELGLDAIKIVRVFKGDNENAEAAWDERVLIVLNLEHDAELYAQGLARTVVNRVQKLRKESNLTPLDSIQVLYTVKAKEGDSTVPEVITRHATDISQALDAPFVPRPEDFVADASVISSTEFELQDAELSVTILKP